MDRGSLAPWVAYFDRVSGVTRRHQAEAADHVRRLRAAVVIQRGLRLLDFGCGPGLVGALLAPDVDRYLFWDAAPAVLQEAIRRLGRVASAVPAPADLAALPAESIDLILVNSVVQYMGPVELATWLPRWRRLLAPGGRLLLSDLPPPGEGAIRALGDTLRFAASRGLLMRALPEAVGALARYSARRTRTPLFRPGTAELARLAAAAGLSTERLAENLTFRAGRYAVVLRPSGAEPAGS